MLHIDRKLIFLDIEATALDILTARPWEIAMIERWPDGRELRTLLRVSNVDLCYAEDEALQVGRFHERHRSDGVARWLTEELAAFWVARRTREDPTLGRAVLVGSAVGTYDMPILAGMLARHGFTPEWSHHPIDLVTWAQAREAFSPFGNVPLSLRSYELSQLSHVAPPAPEVRHTAMGDAVWARDWWDAIKGLVS